MPGYIVLMKFTDKGLAAVKDSVKRNAANKAAAEKMGVRIIGVWWTLGEYDLVGVAEAPDDKTAAAFMLAAVGQGFFTSQTMRAFSEEEFAQIVNKLP